MSNDVIALERPDCCHLVGIGHFISVQVNHLDTADGIVDLNSGVTQQEERQLVGIGSCKSQFRLHVSLAQGRHFTSGRIAEHALDKVPVEHIITRGIYHTGRGKQGDSATVTLVEHQLGNTTRVTVIVGNVAACS